jgi:outer membrane protein assembly factor BamB
VWTAGVDGALYASPLIVGGHAIVATENNTVYSFDLFTGAKVWERHLGDPVDAATLPCGNISPVTGITGTPAADPASGRVYAVAFLKGYHHVLYAMSLTDGSVAWQQTIDPAGSNPKVQQLRGALAIGSGMVYVPFGGLFGDCGDYRGYVVGVPLRGGQAHAFVVAAARGASIWAPQGPTIGPDGSVYVVTGNALSSGFGYSDSVIQLSPDLQTVRSYFAPSNWAELNAGDVDLGSTGVALVTSMQRGVVVGKEGVAYLLKMGALGGIGGQVASRKVCAGAWGGTAWSGTQVFVPCSDGLFALSATPDSIAIQWFTGRPQLASPIVAAGAIWAIDSPSGVLYALSPVDGKTMFTINIGPAMHFATPAATEGFILAPAGTKVVAISVTG